MTRSRNRHLLWLSGFLLIAVTFLTPLQAAMTDLASGALPCHFEQPLEPEEPCEHESNPAILGNCQCNLSLTADTPLSAPGHGKPLMVMRDLVLPRKGSAYAGHVQQPPLRPPRNYSL